MTDYFVDATIVGGNGLSAQSAYASVNSVVWGIGDRAWVRKTHTELLTNSNVLGPNSCAYDRSFFASVIGWPSSGDPWYADRPISGTSAGWDAEHSALPCYTTYGYDFPTFTASGNNPLGFGGGGFLLGMGAQIFNVCMDNSGSTTNACPWTINANSGSQCFMDNVIPLYKGGPISQWSNAGIPTFGKLIMVCVNTNNVAFFSANGPFNIRHLLVHSASNISSYGLFNSNILGARIGLMEVNANSFYALGGRNSNQERWEDFYNRVYIERIVGVKPLLHNLNYVYTTLRCDDYYNEGPVIRGGEFHSNTRVASTGEALHAGSSVTHYSANSSGLARGQYLDNQHVWPSLKKKFSVTSGTAITINVPFYVDSTGTYVPTNGTMRAGLQVLGCNQRVANSTMLIAGSYTNWTGSLISGGSAYIWQITWTPAETKADATFDLFPARWTQAASGANLSAYALLGEPY